MAEENEEELIEFSESIEKSHREYLREFKEKVFPVYKREGFTLYEALMMWQSNSIYNLLNERLP